MRIVWILLFGCVMAGFFFFRSEPDGRLNVILISIDSVRADHLSLYGYHRETMPHLTEWARDAVVFNDYYATSFLTPISEMSVHTGRYPFTHGVTSFESPLRGDVPTLAEVLKEGGWQTAAFGSSPEFQWFKALVASFSRGFEVFPEQLRGLDSVRDHALAARGGNPVSEAVSWLMHTRDTRRPFFLWIPMGSAHWPFGQNFPRVFSDAAYDGYFAHAPSNWQTYGMVYNGGRYVAATTTEYIGGVASSNYVTSSTPSRVEELSEGDLSFVRDRYDDGLYATDAMLAELFRYLKAEKLEESTIVVVQSEHGEAFGEYGYIGHYDINETEVHVPLMMRIPHVEGRREDVLISGVDLMPTLLAFLDVSHGGMDGYDFQPYLTKEAVLPPRDRVFLTRVPLWESTLYYAFGDKGKGLREREKESRSYDVAVQTKEWKLVHRLSRETLAEYSWWGWVSGESIRLPEYQLYTMREAPFDRREYRTDVPVPAFNDLLDSLTTFERTYTLPVSVPKGQDRIQEYF